MDWGMQNRISRVIKPADGRTVMLAVDHGYFLGPTTGLEDIRKNITPLAPYADSLMLNRGALRQCIDPGIDTPIVLRVSGGTSILGDLSDEVIAVSMEEAIRMNVAAVAVSIFVGSKHEKETLDNLCRLVNEGERCGIPVLAVTAVGKEMARDVRYLGLASRIAAELGARIVKTYYCDEFEKLTENVPVPVVIAGGKKLEEKAALELTHNAVSCGAAGVDMGRNIFQCDAPAAMIQAVRSIVHDNYPVEKAWNLFNSLKSQAVRAK